MRRRFEDAVIQLSAWWRQRSVQDRCVAAALLTMLLFVGAALADRVKSATWLQTGAVLATAWLLVWYAWETRRMGLATERMAQAAKVQLDVERHAEIYLRVRPSAFGSGRPMANLVNLGRGGAADIVATADIRATPGIVASEPEAVTVGCLVSGESASALPLSGAVGSRWIVYVYWYEPSAHDWQCRCFSARLSATGWQVDAMLASGIASEAGEISEVCSACRNRWGAPGGIPAAHCPAIESRQRRLHQTEE